MRPLRLVNARVKAYRKAAMGRMPSSVRRIEQVYPPQGKLVVAMTFDDGPTCAPARPGDGKGITESILDTMKAYDAKGVFDVIGTTHANYPDKEGRLGTALWSGVRFDHYPEFGQDGGAGAVNQTDLARRILDEGHELANHGYRHVAFGPSRVVYGSRGHFSSEEEVYLDIMALHEFVQDRLGFRMRLGRPPHYIDGIPGGKNAYDVYAKMKYNYLAASVDGGGWKPSSGDYQKDVDEMINVVKDALAKDPKCLNGHIIFQKDGYNMSKQSPVVDALPRQLQILRDYGYEVCTVSRLLNMSPFVDLPPSSAYFDSVRALADQGYAVGFRDNSFRPDKHLEARELEVILKGPWPESGGAAEGVQTRRGGADKVTASALACSLISRFGVQSVSDGLDPNGPVRRDRAVHMIAKAMRLS